MRKFILLSLLFLISICGIEAQNVSPHYVDGMLYVINGQLSANV